MAYIELPDVVDVYDNDTFDWTLTVLQPGANEEDPPVVFDLSEVVSACMQWRKQAGAPRVDLTLSTANGRFFIPDPVNGVIAFLVKPDVLRILEKGVYSADIVFTIGDIDRRCRFANIDLKPGASHC
ncbi:hypothetical protein [Microbaculum marinisediminis]|uniref:Uncharacterized protein n=1 Tax=Microbaculum marinisediminis TaxID=2931392 RepID=A0AAW5QW09_9HYPH|nr:hypothetical protein [Microbaculum sp. A6E488]MCT8970573.1 hypothetical protein [Microbaculum sp. A6E488]